MEIILIEHFLGPAHLYNLLALKEAIEFTISVCDRPDLVEEAGGQSLVWTEQAGAGQFESLQAPPAQVGLSVGEVGVAGLDCRHWDGAVITAGALGLLTGGGGGGGGVRAVPVDAPPGRGLPATVRSVAPL